MQHERALSIIFVLLSVHLSVAMDFGNFVINTINRTKHIKIHTESNPVDININEDHMTHNNLTVLKILPLGDSITFGCGDICIVGDRCAGGYGENYTCCAIPTGNPLLPWTPCLGCSGSYRVPLLDLLKSDYTTKHILWEFVGTQTMDDGLKHEGHPGWRIDQLSVAHGNWTIFAPDIIILLAGTNDIGELYVNCKKNSTPSKCNTTKIIKRLDILLAQTFLALPKVHIFISDLIGIGPNSCYWTNSAADVDKIVLSYNSQLPLLVKKYQEKGNKCSHIPLLSNTNLGQNGENLCPCNYHPTHHGYSIMAQEYFKYIKQYYPKIQS